MHVAAEQSRGGMDVVHMIYFIHIMWTTGWEGEGGINGIVWICEAAVVTGSKPASHNACNTVPEDDEVRGPPSASLDGRGEKPP